MTLRVTSFALSRTGAREHNEDAYADTDLTAGRCAVVADGAGGHRGGAMAARLTVETVLLSLAQAPSWTDMALVAAIDAAGAVIRQRREEKHGRVDMVSTVAVLCIDAGVRSARWAHLGDTRILFFRRGAVTLLTRDHSIRQSFVDASLVADDPLAAGPNRSALYAAVGAEGDIRPRVGECLPLEDGDAFLVCSDGVWDTVDAGRLAMLLHGSESAQGWIGAIDTEVRRAARPQQDNYTAIGIWIGSPAEITIIRT
jgi:serine/threonine protein phosphatase PrpC